MRDRAGQFDMAHALAPLLGQGDFHAAFLTFHAAVLQALVFPAQAFVVLDGAENFCAEQSIPLRLEGPVIDGLRFFDFPHRP